MVQTTIYPMPQIEAATGMETGNKSRSPKKEIVNGNLMVSIHDMLRYLRFTLALRRRVCVGRSLTTDLINGFHDRRTNFGWK